MFKAEPVVSLAEKKGVTPAAILLSYHRKFNQFLTLTTFANSKQSRVEALFSPNPSAHLESLKTKSPWLS